MKITLEIKDAKVAFFLELLQSFDEFITVEPSEEVVNITKKHQQLLDARLAAYEKNPEDLIEWKALQQELEKSL